jgi:hypothetical protein
MASQPSFLQNLLNLIKGQLVIEGVPVAIGALQVFEKSPNAAGVAAAELYVLGNAPAALLAGETTLLQTVITDLSTQLAAYQQAAQTAAAAPAPAAPPAAAVTPKTA